MAKRRGLTYLAERRRRSDCITVIAGIDEAGRGPWAGPVVAAAVVLDPRRVPKGLNDSKKLTADAREALAAEIHAHALAVGIGVAEVARIDSDNILAATMWAMGRAVAQLPELPHLALVDGNRAPELGCPVETIIEGDGKVASIAAASIVAKVFRDAMMADLALTFPDYGFEQHKGYGTPGHQLALARLGPCPAHRRSFRPIQAYLVA
jgi:ribonuclease HII